MDSLQKNIDSLKSEILVYHTNDSIRISDSIKLENSLAGIWTLDFDSYTKKPLNDDENSFIEKIKEDLTSLTYYFYANGEMQYAFQKIDSKDLFTVYDGNYTYSSDSAKLVVKINGTGAESNTEYEVLFNTNDELILKFANNQFGNIHLYFKKIKGNLFKFNTISIE
jgi:hypothetical protein